MCGLGRWVEGCVGGAGGWRDVWAGQVGGGMCGRGRWVEGCVGGAVLLCVVRCV